jgi:flagellin FlaB
MNEENITNDNLGSIGIGAMIVFIALILVAAVASAVIIQTGEKLQQNAQQTGSDTQREISGKITLNSVIVKDANTFRVYFESSPGSDVIDEDQIEWQMSCTNPNGGTAGYQYLNGDFGATVHAASGNALAAADDIDSGSSYIVDLTVDGGNGAQCQADTAAGNGLGLNSEVTLWIHVNGGGSTYETLYISDLTPGSLVI